MGFGFPFFQGAIKNTHGWERDQETVKPPLFFSRGAGAGETLTERVERDEEDILDGIWPGSHNALLLTQFVACHLTGDWLA
jgi:hypothetical protein